MSAEPARLPRPDDVDALRAALEQMQAAQDKMARDMLGMERDLKAKRSRITFLENELAGRDRADPLYGIAYELFEFWRKHCAPRAKTFSDDRLKAVLARLKDKSADDRSQPAYTPRYIAEAIVGAQHGCYVDPKGKRHNDLELICRSGRRLEAFHDKYEAHMAAKNGSAA